jgi:hypothetical protein
VVLSKDKIRKVLLIGFVMLELDTS